MTDLLTWPEPYLQPDRKQDCGFYAAAYLARCLGHPDVTAGQVKAWRAEARCHEDHYVRRALGAEMRNFWDACTDDTVSMAENLKRGRFWMGPGTEAWVRSWLSNGWIAHAEVHRIAEFGHAVVLLDATDDGVLLMDPLCGHVTEPWDWFLGSGPNTAGAHYVAGWYRRPELEDALWLTAGAALSAPLFSPPTSGSIAATRHPGEWPPVPS